MPKFVFRWFFSTRASSVLVNVSVVAGSVISMPSELVLDRPPVSVTRTATVAVPGRRSVSLGLALFESSYWPSPSRSHA